VKFVSLPDIPDVIERITISYVVKDTEHWSASVGRDMSCNRLGWHDANQIALLPDGYKRVRRTCSLVLREAALELTVAVDALCVFDLFYRISKVSPLFVAHACY
jgi:hypothetical protein